MAYIRDSCKGLSRGAMHAFVAATPAFAFQAMTASPPGTLILSATFAAFSRFSAGCLLVSCDQAGARPTIHRALAAITARFFIALFLPLFSHSIFGRGSDRLVPAKIAVKLPAVSLLPQFEYNGQHCHSGAARRAEPGIHEHWLFQGLCSWIPSSRAVPAPRNDKSAFQTEALSLFRYCLSKRGDGLCGARHLLRPWPNATRRVRR